MSGIVHAEDGFVKDRLKTALNFRVQRFVVAGNIPVTGARRGFYKAEFRISREMVACVASNPSFRR